MKKQVLPVARGFAIAMAFALATGSAVAATLTVEIAGVTAAGGNVRVALCNDPAGFPGKVFAGQEVPAKPGKVTVVFDGLQPGTYAVTAFQDVDGNKKLNRNAVGMPTEPYGFSRNARGAFGPPSFDEAKFDLGDEKRAIQFDLR